MKAILVTGLVGLWGATGTALSQGVVTFHNDGASCVTNSLTGNRAAAGGSFLAALYYAPNAATAPHAASFVPLGTAIAISPPGYYIGPNTKTPAANEAWFQVRVWESAYGPTYEQAIAAPAINGRGALRGTSAKFKAFPSLPGLNPPPSLTDAGLSSILLETGPPHLRITRASTHVVLSWTSDNATFRLEQSATLPAPSTDWNAVTIQPVSNGPERTITLEPTAFSQFYRLVSP